MIRHRHIVTLSIAALLLAGCHKQAPVTPAPAAHAPTIEPQPPPQIPPVATSSTPATVHSAAEAAAATPTKPKPTHRARRTKPSPIISPPPVTAETHPESETEAANAPVPAKPVPELQITTPAGLTEDHTRGSTEQLLDSTDRDLSKWQPRSKEEMATVQQIRSYQKDARDALQAEDLTRAHNLALKAQLLASSLVRAH